MLTGGGIPRCRAMLKKIAFAALLILVAASSALITKTLVSRHRRPYRLPTCSRLASSGCHNIAADQRSR